MKRVIVRYKVKPGQGDENCKYIRQVFSELKEKGPAGLRYASFMGEDQQTFIHVASIETPDGTNPLGETVAFKEFQAKLKERCEEPPIALSVTEVGSYRFFE